MKEQSETITKDEWLLRRVHKEYVDSGLLLPAAFRPIGSKGKNPDRRGISLYRQSCLQSANKVFQDIPEEKKLNYGIATVSVEFLLQCGLGVLPDDDEISGHVLIPEINCEDYESSKDRKDRVSNFMFKLAEHVNEVSSLLFPFPHPCPMRWDEEFRVFKEHL